jgi:phospholipase C
MRYVAALTLLLLAETAHAAPQFNHIIVVVQENRTPDNLFGSNPGFEPGVDIATSGVNSMGATVPLTAVPLASCYDLSHAHGAFVLAYNNGKMNGGDEVNVNFIQTCDTGAHPQYRYVGNTDGTVQPYFDIAKQYGFDNRMFQTNQGPSFPAHQFLFGGTSAPTEMSTLFAAENMVDGAAAGCTAPAGQRVAVVDALGNEFDYPPVYPCFNRPTMADLLDGAGLSWRYYLNTVGVGSIWNAPAAIKDICAAQSQSGVLNCTGTDYVNNVVNTQGQVLTDIANCNLPKVSWVIPSAEESDHAGINNGTGPAWVASIVNAVGTQPTCASNDNYWQDTAIFITWDDWGGWYDHVPPFHVGGDGGTHKWGDGYTYGFRVPLLVVSAFTAAGTITNTPHDFGSILQYIETNFGLHHIGPGFYADAHANALTGYFNLTTARTFTPIAAPENASYFIHHPTSNIGPDND